MAKTKQHVRKAALRPKKNSREYFIWCDESDSKGKFCSNFYGGVLVKSTDLAEVQATLRQACRKLHFFDEIKWHKVSQHYVEKYKKAMDVFFQLVAEEKIKVRIMFTQNAYVATRLTDRHTTEEFFILYYQFIKHAFGLPYSNNTEDEIYLRLYFDYLPDTLERRQVFKEYIRGLQTSRPFQLAKMKIRKQDIAEVDSKKHLVLQLLDVVLGAMCFRLNNKHREIPPGKKRRGKRTVAKEKLYKHINQKLRQLRPGFNVGANTGIEKKEDYWLHPYRHWVFRPSAFEIDTALFK
ncbi:MAG TPA: DUF3800 domain-containing protein [Flavisolibacter sp.]|jgi:hypothetical protein|nr:DUF3800 domain-containing protein [Flavisolibacter sp.]